MDEYTYSHVIKSIENIREDGKVNKYHKHILGKRCNIQCGMVPGCMGAIIVEPFWCYPTPKWFYTTIIQDIKEETDGSIVMRTQNTVYTFAPNPGGDNNDLSGQCCDDAD